MDRISVLLLGSARLVTLIGAGGIGKTRLAAEAVRRLQRARHTTVHWVRLARLAKGSDMVAVADEVAQSVVDTDFSGRSVWDALVGTLAVGRNRQAVLVMDNCEHVLVGAGQVIADLLAAMPGLTILATSREAVGWVDEQLLTVPPLTQEQALTLFRQRAELTGRSVTGPDQIEMADEICRHMHNHPLYVRLAAARLLRQPLPRIIAELSGADNDRRMQWSHGPRVGAEQRHQGVHDVIAWSYDLCDDKERLLLERMSVFAAGYDTNPEDDGGNGMLDVGADLEAIAAVCADDDSPTSNADQRMPRLTKAEIDGVLERLVEQSLVSEQLTPTTVRYSQLESIRVFAQHRLRNGSADGAEEAIRLAKRHRQYYRDKVVRAQADWFSPAEQDMLDWARAAWNNILSAIDGSIAEPGEATLGLEISVGLISLRVPFFKGSLREMRRWTERTLEATRTLDPQPRELQIGAMALIGWVTLCQGRHADAEAVLQQCVEACLPELGPTWRATPQVDIGLPAPVEFTWGAELMLVRRDADAVAVLARARAKFSGLGDRGGEAMAELFEALAAGFFGSAEQAMTTARRHLDHATASGAKWALSWAELAWALALTKNGDPAEALAVGRAALTHQLAARDQWGALWAVHIRQWSLAQIITDIQAAAQSPDNEQIHKQATEIAQLSGGARRLRAEIGVNIAELGPFDDENNKAIDTARRILGEQAYAAAEKQGALLRPKLAEVQRLAIGTLAIDKMPLNHPARKDTPSHWDTLTTAEQQVALLAAAGWTNTAIATRRGSSYKTVDAQMTAIFQKLTITSRDEIITLMPKAHLAAVNTEAARRPQRASRRDGRTS